MTRRRAQRAALTLLFAAALVLALSAQAQTVSVTPYSGFTQGVACSSNGALGYNGNSFVLCASGAWAVQPITIGSTSASCGSTNAGMVYWGGSSLEVCNGSSWTALATTIAAYDMAMFYPGTIGASAFVRAVAGRAATYPTGLTGSTCVAKEGATSSTTVNINQIHAGSSTNVGTVVFGSGGGTNVTNCTFTAASGMPRRGHQGS